MDAFIKRAYDFGVSKALKDFGITKVGGEDYWAGLQQARDRGMGYIPINPLTGDLESPAGPGTVADTVSGIEDQTASLGVDPGLALNQLLRAAGNPAADFKLDPGL